MANILESIAWRTLKPKLEGWLNDRALVLPATKKAELATRFGVPVDVVTGLNVAMIEEADGALDSFKP